MSNSLSMLPEEEQISRLTGLARRALEAFLPYPAELVLLSHWQNTSFRVDVDGRPRYCLRICRPGKQTGAALESEALWLEALRRDIQAPVPEPLAVDGRHVLFLRAPGVAEPRACMVFQWQEGETVLRSASTPALYEEMGRTLAMLHRHSETWRRPGHFTRMRWDAQGLLETNLCIDTARARAHFTSEELAVIDAASGVTRAVMEALGERPELFNLVHADCGSPNFLVHGGEFRLLDFDDAGFGYFIYDLAVPLMTTRDHPDAPRLRTALLAGYRSVRSLSGEELRFLDHFIMARITSHVLWLAGHCDEVRFGSRALLRARQEVVELRVLLSRLQT